MRLKLLLVLAAVVVASSSEAAMAAFPGKPGRIAFSARALGESDHDIFTVAATGGPVVQVTQNVHGSEEEHDVGPEWSPSGGLIGFTVEEHPHMYSVPSNLIPNRFAQVMGADGSGIRVVPGLTWATFAPDGSMCSVPDYEPHLGGTPFPFRCVPVEGPGRKPPYTFAELAKARSYAMWSPDRRSIVYEYDYDIYMNNTVTDRVRRLTFTPDESESSPVFSPDGSAIAFVFGGRVAVVDVRSRQFTYLTELGPARDASTVSWGRIPVRCRGKRATLVGTDRRDVLHGTKGNDVIAALGGKDLIKGHGGNDRFCGGPGRDRVIP